MKNCIDTNSSLIANKAPLARAGRWTTIVIRMATLVLTWQERARQRRHLSQLDTYLLRDVGLTHADVRREADKPFWRE